MFGEKRVGAHDEAGCTIAALCSPLLRKCFLYGVQFALARQALYSEQLRAIRLCGEHTACIDGPPIQDDSTPTAVACAADKLGPFQVACMQRLQQRFARFNTPAGAASIDCQVNLYLRHGAILLSGELSRPSCRLSAG